MPEVPLPDYWRKEHKTGIEQEGRLAYQQCLSLPIEWIHENQALLEKAAEIKALYQLSLADAKGAIVKELKKTRGVQNAYVEAKKAHDIIYQEDKFEAYGNKNNLKI